MCITPPSRQLCRRLAKSLESSSFTFCALCCFVSCLETSTFTFCAFFFFSCFESSSFTFCVFCCFVTCAVCGLVGFNVFMCGSDLHHCSQTHHVTSSFAGIMIFPRLPPRCRHTSSTSMRAHASERQRHCHNYHHHEASFDLQFFFLILVPLRSYLKDVGIQHSLVPSLGD